MRQIKIVPTIHLSCVESEEAVNIHLKELHDKEYAVKKVDYDNKSQMFIILYDDLIWK